MCYCVIQIRLQVTEDLWYCFFSGEPPSLPELIRFRVPQQVGPHYKIFGTLLLNDKTGSEVDSMKKACLGIPVDIVVSILQEWLTTGKGRPLTWEALIETLKDCDLDTVADQIDEARNH